MKFKCITHTISLFLTHSHTYTYFLSLTHIQTLSLSLSLTHTFIKCSQILKENIKGQTLQTLLATSRIDPQIFFYHNSDPWLISFRTSYKSSQSDNPLETRSCDGRTDGQSADNSFLFPRENALKRTKLRSDRIDPSDNFNTRAKKKIYFCHELSRGLKHSNIGWYSLCASSPHPAPLSRCLRRASLTLARFISLRQWRLVRCQYILTSQRGAIDLEQSDAW